ncbi:MAG: thioredoxin [Candidatus Eisenbacteria bacterium]|nr:thioredoxin [Candidatus Eisenbacteria bacterium]
MSDPIRVTDANYEELIEKSAKPAVLDFGATWCGPCKAMDPTMAALAGEYGDRVVVSKLDIDEAPSLAQRFGILSVPTIIFFKGGKEVHRFSGVQSKDKIAALIQSHLLAG